MSEYKPITGELRNSMTYDITTTPNVVSTASIDTVEFVNICDTIDAIHANLERENESLKAELDRARDEWDFWESTHVELPKDADGEYIRIGDEVETTNFGTVEVEGFVHRAVAFYNYSEQPAYLCTTPANLCRHHHAPTVEDVLREFICDHEEGIRDEIDLIAEYAAKLQLAGDAE